MSVEATYKTVLNDEACLLEALKSLYGEHAIKVVAAGVQVKGFHSQKKPTIVIELPDLYGTAGFCKSEDGTFEAVYDSTDRSRLTKLFPKKQGNITINPLNQAYAKAKVVKSLKNVRGNIVQDEITEAGEVHIRVRTTQYGM